MFTPLVSLLSNISHNPCQQYKPQGGPNRYIKILVLVLSYAKKSNTQYSEVFICLYLSFSTLFPPLPRETHHENVLATGISGPTKASFLYSWAYTKCFAWAKISSQCIDKLFRHLLLFVTNTNTFLTEKPVMTRCNNMEYV